MTVENDQFRAFFRMVPQKLAFFGKRGRFRAKSHEIKVVGNSLEIFISYIDVAFDVAC